MTDPTEPTVPAWAAHLAQVPDHEALDAIRHLAQRVPDDQLTQLALLSGAEKRRRETVAGADAARVDLVQQLRDAGTITGPDAGDPGTPLDELPEWVDPGTDHTKMYTHGQCVREDGRAFQSTHPGLNHWRPGEVDARIWAEYSPTNDELTGPIPYTDDRNYTAGDVVEFEGETYTCTADHHAAPGWNPVNAHAYWTKHEA